MKKHYFLFALLFSLNFSDGQIINFPDIGFKTKLLQADTNVFIARNALNQNIKIDTNNNGEIEVVEALTVYSLNVTGNVSITDLTGIENFTTLREIQCSNQSLSSLNVTSLINLEMLFCNGNNLTNLNVSGLINLKQLYCSFNLLTNLNLSNLTNLERAICSHNDLTSLNLSNLTSLKILSCADNELTTVDVSDSYNLLTFSASNNLLTLIKLKNGSNETSISFQYNPNIQYICVDDSQITTVQDLVTTYGYVNCNINSYCSFNPGGTFYTIQGSNKYDENNNGCNVTNSFFPNLKLTLSDGTNSGSLICDTNGNYECNVQSGTHAITPILENPSYFSVSPTNVTVTFPTTPSTFIQNFCITPNGIHNDLEVVILPLNNARPGFDANYKISYKNKGTHTQSGNVNLTFNDAGLDFVTATPPFTSQVTNVLNWSFTNLAPFETREILFTLNVNSPTETPAVNSGDVLNYTTVITGLTDETPSDNSVALNQTVVNALDPNDKKCLEGNTIPPNMVGEYVHYIIRFENSGTANAQNIVVMDRIDTNRFEISSLLPISGSDSFVTRIPILTKSNSFLKTSAYLLTMRIMMVMLLLK